MIKKDVFLDMQTFHKIQAQVTSFQPYKKQ